MKSLKLYFLILAGVLFNSCGEDNNDDLNLLRKYLKIDFREAPELVGETTNCADLDCNLISVYQLNTSQGNWFLKYLQTDNVNHWHKSSEYYRLDPLNISNSKFLEVEYIPRNKLLVISKIEI